MSVHTPTMQDHLAGLRLTAETGAARGGRLHAVLMACLARLFARLEQLLSLWQAGALPVPPPRPPRRRTARTSHRCARRPRHTSRRRHSRVRPAPRRREACALWRVGGARTPRRMTGRAPSPPQRSARAPPPRTPAKAATPALQTHVDNITIT